MPESNTLQILTKLFPEVNAEHMEKLLGYLEEGFTIPFISHYRGAHIGQIDEDTIRAIARERDDYLDFERRRQQILKTLEDRELLNDELKGKIVSAQDRLTLEETFLPYKPRRKTKASAAREKGVGPLADKIFAQDGSITSLEEEAKAYVNPEKGLESTEDVLKEAGFIIADIINTDPEARSYIREHVFNRAVIRTRVAPGKESRRSKYMDYYDFSEAVDHIPSHRVLAIRRGEKEGFLKVVYEFDGSIARSYLSDRFVKAEEGEVRKFILECIEDAMLRLIAPSFENEIRSRLKRNADEEAIKIFCANLRQLLLSPPSPKSRVMAIDPSYRSGCLVVLLNEEGKLIHQEEIAPDYNRPDDPNKAKFISLVKDHNIDTAVIAEGSASRDIHIYLRRLVRDTAEFSLTVTLIDETASKVYAGSELGKNEFPNLEQELRKCISLGRRHQDPLAELVKVDPKHIGVGQYQHDVDQGLLKEALHDVVETCVNAVGAELNSSTPSLLSYIAGLDLEKAQAIAKYRAAKPFPTRIHLIDVEGIDAGTFHQAAGFLRVAQSPNPLDNTFVHPEHYELVDRIAKHLGVDTPNLIGHTELLDDLDMEEVVDERFPLEEIREVVLELMTPGRDPRSNVKVVQFREDVCELADLQEGMILEGKVTNVTNFGVFVDIGVHQDGLVHVSELSHSYIKDPTEMVGVADVVTVKVIGVDLDRRRISLSIKAAEDETRRDEPMRQGGRRLTPEEEMLEYVQEGGKEFEFSDEMTFGDDSGHGSVEVKGKKKKKKKSKKKAVKSGAPGQHDHDDDDDEGVVKPKDFDSEEEFLTSLEKLKKHFGK